MRRASTAFVAASALCLGCGAHLPAPSAPGPGGAAGPLPEYGVATPVLDGNGRHRRIHYTDSVGSNLPGGLEILSLGPGIDLSAARLLQQRSQPGLDVEIAGVPTTMGKVRVAFLAPDSSLFCWGMLRVTDDGKISLMTPVLPPEVTPEGKVSLAVFVRGAQSPVLELGIDPPPPAPADKGAQAVIQKIAQIVDDPTTGQATSAIGRMIHALLDDPTNPNSIAKIFDGTAAMLEGQQVIGAGVLDSVVANAGVAASLDSYKAALAQNPAARKVAGLSSEIACNAEIAAASDLGLADFRALEDAEADTSSSFSRLAAAVSGFVSSNPIPDTGWESQVTELARQQALAKKIIDALLVAMNEGGILLYLNRLEQATNAPSRIVLDRPELVGGIAFNPDDPRDPGFFTDGLTLYPGTVSMGKWGVTGTITNKPVTITSEALLSILTAPRDRFVTMGQAVMAQLGLDAAGEIASNAAIGGASTDWLAGAWKGTLNFFGVDTRPSYKYQDLLTYLKSNVADWDAKAPDITYYPDTHQIRVGSPKIIRRGDLTEICEASFSDPQAVGTYRHYFSDPLDGMKRPPIRANDPAWLTFLFNLAGPAGDNTFIIKKPNTRVTLTVRPSRAACNWGPDSFVPSSRTFWIGRPPAAPGGVIFNPSTLSPYGHEMVTLSTAPGYTVPAGTYWLGNDQWFGNPLGLQTIWYLADAAWYLYNAGRQILWSKVYQMTGPESFLATWGEGHGIAVTVVGGEPQVNSEASFSVTVPPPPPPPEDDDL